MPRHLSNSETALLLRLYYDEKLTQTQIAARLNCCQKTVSNKIDNFRSEHRLGRKKSERKLKADTDTLESLDNSVDFDPFISLTELKNELNLPYALTTISKYVKRTGLKSYISPKKFLVERTNAEKRVDWASLRRRNSVEQWKVYLFSDESGMENATYFRKRVWRRRGQRFDQRYIFKHSNATFKRVNYFSWVGPSGTGALHFYDKMNSQMYCQCVHEMIDELREKFEHDNFVVIHDNARWANSRHTVEYLRNNDLERFLEFIPARSPDINIIENLWKILKERVRKRMFVEGQVRNRDDYLELVACTWSGIELEIVNNLYESLPKRMSDIIKSGGQLIKY